MGTVSGTAVAPEPHSTVLYSAAYEVRRYDPYLIAEINLANKSEAFSVLANYVGKVKSYDKLPLSPSKLELESSEESQQSPSSVVIEITAPVITEETAMRFILPSRYTAIEQLPEPKDDRVVIKQVPGYVVAVLTFNGTCGEKRVLRKLDKLKGMLAADRLRGVEAEPSAVDQQQFQQKCEHRQQQQQQQHHHHQQQQQYPQLYSENSSGSVGSGCERVMLPSRSNEELKIENEEDEGAKPSSSTPEHDHHCSTQAAAVSPINATTTSPSLPPQYKWSLAQYSSPYILPFLRRNEIWVELNLDNPTRLLLLEATMRQRERKV